MHPQPVLRSRPVLRPLAPSPARHAPHPRRDTSSRKGSISASLTRPASLSLLRSLGLGLTAALTLACADTTSTTDTPAPVDPAAEAAALARSESGSPAEQRAQQARASVDALLADPSPRTLLPVLAQNSVSARTLLGPHRLHYTAGFTIVPELPSRPVVDQPVQLEQKVTDELTLVVGSAFGDPLALHLSQKTDKGEGREVIILDEQVYTRLAHRGWNTRALDSELHNVWLDEAQHCVHDMIELAAPALAVTVQDSGDAVEVTLRRADAVDPTLVVAGHGREWRQRSELGEITGSITLDRATGLWRKAELSVAYVVRDVLDRPQRGVATLSATAEPGAAADLVVVAPQPVAPAPERTRPELERQRLLHGLAGT